MKRSLWLLSIIPILFCLLFLVSRHNPSTRGASQSQQNETRGGAFPPPHAAIEGKAAGKVMPFKPASGDLKAALLVHPSAELWLTFPAATSTGETPTGSVAGTEKTARTDLSPEARNALSACWEVYLSAHYNISVAPLHDANGLFNEKARLINAINVTRNQLLKSKIAAPDGMRDISYYEVEDLMNHFLTMAGEVIDQALEHGK